MRKTGAGRGGRYHHGDLRAALIDAAIEVIGERGIRGFSLAETSRRLGVTAAAPYSHFADRDALLVAVALHAGRAFAATITAETPRSPDPADRLAAAARGYVRFADISRPLFEVLFSAGLDKHDHPELAEMSAQIAELFLVPARELSHTTGDADGLASATAVVAHGHATLLLDGAFGTGEAARDLAMGCAAAATHAIVLGLSALAADPAIGARDKRKP